MPGVLNREIARQERAQENAKDQVIERLQKEKAALRQAMYELAIELADARVTAALFMGIGQTDEDEGISGDMAGGG
jgi:inosine/xanthosine triphosphate pyrophosphatase family protein